MGGVREVSEPPGGREDTGEGEGRTSNKLITAMAEMDVEVEDMEEGMWRRQTRMKQRRKGEGGGTCWHWKPQGS